MTKPPTVKLSELKAGDHFQLSRKEYRVITNPARTVLPTAATAQVMDLKTNKAVRILYSKKVTPFFRNF